MEIKFRFIYFNFFPSFSLSLSLLFFFSSAFISRLLAPSLVWLAYLFKAIAPYSVWMVMGANAKRPYPRATLYFVFF